ncbi:MAG TPA: SEC-C metal-binding domain-containing protein [Syntrophales bacterium]|nr:SEC-C metal-binding domain-containing protein [Syntrophales bacterium]
MEACLRENDRGDGTGGVMETGRNAPCPCGSGKKYKKCCLKTLEPDRDSEWRRLGEAYLRLQDRLIRFTERMLRQSGMVAAYDEFLLWPDEEVDEQLLDRLGPLFASWSMFNWTYDPADVDGSLRLPPGVTPAEFFLEKEKGRLDDTERELIAAISRGPFRFCEVIRCEPGRGFLLKDVLTEQEVDVREPGASRVAREGDILFCRVTPIRGMNMLFGCSNFAIPPEFKPEIIELRSWMRQACETITEAELLEYDFEIREAFLEIGHKLSRIPALYNTDGERLLMHTLHYEIDSPEQAFTRLAGLSAGESETDLRNRAKLDDRGQISKLEIPWSRKGFRDRPNLQNTILGTMAIDGGSLKVTVNSSERAATIRKEIETRLGSGARYKTTVIETAEHMMQQVRSQDARMTRSEAEHDELMQNPEIKAKLAEIFASHWGSWMDEKIPALGGKTPRQAVRTADGREGVEALLRSAERHAAADKDMGDEILKALEGVRRRLNLPRR